MKQHITEDQWNEISPEQKYYFQWGKKLQPNSVLLLKTELPNIGKMIEFLGERWYDQFFTGLLDTTVEYTWNFELCDALWEVVKQSLDL